MAASFKLPPHATARLLATHQKHAVRVGAPRRKGSGCISFAVGRCVHGPILIARTRKGVCALLLGGNAKGEAELERDLIRRFPTREIKPSSQTQMTTEEEGRADEEMSSICQYLADPSSYNPPEVALDLHGTPFQQSVWKALAEIPPGKTETYSQLARRAELPTSSVRAVANACGQNPVAFLIPCHRITRTDGGLGGYFWGVQMKTEMLQLEGARR